MGQTFELGEDTRPPADDLGGDAVDQYRSELVDMRARVCRFVEDDPSDVLAAISGMAGRLSEIRANLFRLGTQRAQALRTREVDPLREDMEFQFKVHSRRIALWEWELKMTTGGA